MRAFRKEFYPSQPRKVPSRMAFHRLIERFKDTGSIIHQHGVNPKTYSVDDVKRVEDFFNTNDRSHLREAAEVLGLSIGKVWRILRNDLKWKPYRPHFVQHLSTANMESRLAACSFWLTFDEIWFERVIWSDEKWFVLTNAPNRSHARYWAPYNPDNVIDCKKAHGQKVMCWAGFVDGACLPIVWFEGSVNHNVYLEKVLKEAVWNSVKSTATRKQIWFQQDGASCHVTPACLDFLKSKFGTRVISRKTEHIWPPYSPDLSPMDFSFWSYVLSHVIRCQPATIQELKMIVSDFISNMEPDYLRKIARQTRRRAEFCVSQNGGHFEHLLKKKCN